MLVRSLADAGLIDEYHVIVHPVVVETGDRLFDGIHTRTELTLVDVAARDEGAARLTYHRRG